MKFTCTSGGHILLANYDRKFDVIYSSRGFHDSHLLLGAVLYQTWVFRIFGLSQICQKQKAIASKTAISLFIILDKDDTLHTTVERKTYPTLQVLLISSALIIHHTLRLTNEIVEFPRHTFRKQ